MTVKNKRKLKIRFKAGACLALESVLIYNLVGTIGSSVKAGFTNTMKEMNYTAYNFLTERKNDYLNYIGKEFATTLKVDLLDLDTAVETIKSCPNLKYLEIYNAQKVSYSFSELINKMGLSEVRLVFDKTDTLRLMNQGKKYDLNFFDDKSIIKDIRFSEDEIKEEFDNVILLNYLDNYEDLDLDFTKDKYLDDYLNQMANTISVDREQPESWDNLIALADYTRSYIQYDPEVLEYTSNIDMKDYDKKNKKIYNRMEYYNEHTFSSILNPNKARIVDPSRQVKGICANYQALFNILCIKIGLECYPLSGLHKEGNHEAPHGWNLIKLNNAYYLIDITRFDSFESCNQLMDLYEQDHSYENFDKVLSNLLIPLDSEVAKEYESDISIESITSGVMLSSYSSMNERVYGTYTSKETYSNFGRDGLYLFILLNLISLMCAEVKKEKKRKQKSLQRKVSYGTI